MCLPRLLSLGLALCLLASGALAGAWPQAKGAGFASATVRLSWPQDLGTWTSLEPTGQYRTLYVEYGLTERLTLGLDLGRSVSGDVKTVAFLRWPLRQSDPGLRVAAEVGLGQIDGAAVLRPGLSLGLGRDWGWMAADALVELPGGGRAAAKLDLTLGLHLPSDRMLLLQVQSGAPADGPGFVRLAPSLVTPLFRKVQTEIGGSWSLTGDRTMGVTMGLWTRF
ncbi:hypothetical protein [Salipiger marinus]|uniref:MetA-pathway of phenol degradation n=1 Tax=Salipiger marinus TaxID=555512 RepID=A0A1G8IX65_9RHOB|nr:hypothetical protein [Salipiger marinus]SDI23423.1 hypothetical protein SAMN04487993_1002173 [Salipiger marinus]